MTTTSGARQSQEGSLDQLIACFEGGEDPRTGNAGLHNFYELLVIALCAVLCGGKGATYMVVIAAATGPFLRGFSGSSTEFPYTTASVACFDSLTLSNLVWRFSGLWPGSEIWAEPRGPVAFYAGWHRMMFAGGAITDAPTAPILAPR
jgi:hypothetical protein